MKNLAIGTEFIYFIDRKENHFKIVKMVENGKVEAFKIAIDGEPNKYVGTTFVISQKAILTSDRISILS